MGVNVNACCLKKCGAFKFIASQLAPEIGEYVMGF
jgi:hypothetical protein